MIRSGRVEKGYVVWLMAVAIVFCSLNTAVAVQGDLPKLLPADTFLYLVIPDSVTTLQEKLKKTSLFALYKDPAMQQFMVPAEKAIREKIEEGIKKAWEELKMDQPPEELPWPTGRVVFAMRMGTKIRTFPEYDRQVGQPAPQFVVIAEMGQNMATLKDIAEKASEKAVDEGAKRQRETIRGLQMQTITPAVPEPAEGDTVYRPSGPEPFCYAFAGETALLSNDADMLRDVLARIGGAPIESLADNTQMEEVMKALGGPGDVNAYWNISTMINSLMDTVPADDKAKAEKAMHALGFDNIAGLGIVAQIAPDQTQEFHIKGTLAVNGEKRGIPALLTPISVNTAGHHLLTKSLGSFMVANYDPEKFFNRINEMVQAMGGPDINLQLVQMMAATSMNDPAGQPAVDFHKEVLGQLSSPVTVLCKVNKPYTDPGASRTLVALAVRDAAVLETALGRIHETFIAQGNKELQRELLGSKIFLLPGVNNFGMIFGMVPHEQGEESPQMAFAVAGNNLVIGSVAGVEQAIRDLRREDLQPIQADPLYSQAARYLPAQSGAWSYENQQITAELFWRQLKEAARKYSVQKDDTDNHQIRIGLGMPLPVADIIEEFEDICDFSTLPEFEVVKKYFGAYITHVKGTERGIYFEGITLKALPDR